ncbi:hypothetical protein DTX80_13430 [Bacilli bacterium]|nr:hypothetical protein DEJ64_11260 [Bacilli bacterium]PZD86153.1 hypothetical protein DEJ60_10910 [Bacilli bacterium]PZD89268.1 hypothetical protein DEJ66_11610 [Bacilli bacterium]RCO05082.1 hypothetical protein DTX80_13430 [Bacilli bacterium]RCO09427.1 hypothetical protein DTX79_10040 [Bacilli bacterium]
MELLYCILNLCHPKRAVRLSPKASWERRRSTARKGPISATNHQWGMKEPLTDGSLLHRRST